MNNQKREGCVRSTQAELTIHSESDRFRTEVEL